MTSLFLTLALLAATPAKAPPAKSPPPEPLRALLLDYHDPIEHDVLQSHLCVDPCTVANKCPQAALEAGVDFWNNDLWLFRPDELGKNAGVLVDRYKDARIDLLSISGHHASGFSGEYGRGKFNTENLSFEVEGVADWQRFFTEPSTVLLQGCWTNVKKGFDGEPIRYVRHIIEETQVRPGESDRLLAAIYQIAGDPKAYRGLFPNACILGYHGKQVPGGLLEIYGQVNAWLHQVAAGRGLGRAAKHDVIAAYRRRLDKDALVERIDRECPGGWPCNLCRQDGDEYRPLQKALIAHLRAERRRLHEEGKSLVAKDALARERTLESASLYGNVRWSCAVVPTTTAPIFPPPIDRAPFAELFLDLLMADLGGLDPISRASLDAELLHFLGEIKLDEAVRERLRLKLEHGKGWIWLTRFEGQALAATSSARQRDFFDFLAEIRCSVCFEALPHDDETWIMRENAASRLRPELAASVFERFLSDPVARVRRAALARLDPVRDKAALERLRRDPDDKVRRAAEARLGTDSN